MPSPLIMTPSQAERRPGNSPSSTPSHSSQGRSINEGILSALRERERVQRHVATQQQQQLLHQQVVPMMAVRSSPKAKSSEIPPSGSDPGDTSRNAYNTQNKDISSASVSPEDVDKTAKPASEPLSISSPPHHLNSSNVPVDSISVQNHGGQSVPVSTGGRGVLVTPRSHLRQLLAEEQAQVKARQEKQERLAAKVEAERKARERSLLPNVSGLVPSFLGGTSTSKEMSTSLIEERIAEMTNPRAMNIHFPSPGGPHPRVWHEDQRALPHHFRS